MALPQGFHYAGVHAGLKPVRRDVALITSDVPAAAAGRFSSNLAAAAPIVDARPRVPSRAIRAVVVNSGNANALTGAAGLADVAAVRAAVGSALGVAADAILCASTGVIGVRLPVAKLVAAAPALVAALAPAPELAAEAILTTDTRTKLASRTLELGGRTVAISAIAKGSGMIAPQLATMLAIVTTDAAIEPALLDRALAAAIEVSFHCLVVDGDTSTNDAIVALANGRAGNAPIDAPGPELDAFTAALTELCIEVARDIAADGEGATRLVEVAVTGAPDAAIARDLARSIAASPLVKAAIFGADPNWGRVLATVGARCGSQRYPLELARTAVAIQGITVFAGEPVVADAAALRTLKSAMRAPEVRIAVALGGGGGAATAWGCDLGYDYVKLNADYTSLIVQSADGTLAKDDRLANYSPTFKRTLLVEALSYIARFAGTRCVVSYGGARRPGLEQSFCADVELLRSCGLQPIVVHAGAAELGAHFVTVLNLDGARAIGVSGADGGLLRARGGEVASVDGTAPPFGGAAGQAQVLAVDGTAPPFGGAAGQAQVLAVDGTAPPFGGAAGQAQVLAVDAAMLEMFLAQGYVPVVTPIALADDGRRCAVDADAAAAELAVALRAPKLIYLADAAGIVANGELVTETTAAALDPAMPLSRAIGRAVAGGVARVHVIDGRTPHGVIAELFTDRGVGTLVTRGEP